MYLYRIIVFFVIFAALLAIISAPIGRANDNKFGVDNSYPAIFGKAKHHSQMTTKGCILNCLNYQALTSDRLKKTKQALPKKLFKRVKKISPKLNNETLKKDSALKSQKQYIRDSLRAAYRFNQKLKTLKRIIKNYGNIIDSALDNYPLPEQTLYSFHRDFQYRLILSIIATESGGRASAIGKKGERGVMQIKPGRDSLLLLNAEYNIRKGTRIILSLVDKYQSYQLALGAYCMGQGGLNKYLKKGKNPENLPYLKKIHEYLNLTSTIV